MVAFLSFFPEKKGDGSSTNKEAGSYFQDTRVRPFQYNSSIYYGGQEVYTPPQPSQTPSHFASVSNLIVFESWFVLNLLFPCLCIDFLNVSVKVTSMILVVHYLVTNGIHKVCKYKILSNYFIDETEMVFIWPSQGL